MLIGEEAFGKLSRSRVALFGIGGVGGYTLEALARSGVGAIDIIDSDVVDISNINRQLIALESTVGKSKVEIAAARLRDIDPDCEVRAFQTFFTPENSKDFDFSKYDYVIDAIDTVTGKLEIIKKANEAGVPVISCMGTGNKLDPGKLQVADIYKTSVCPLARTMRYECRKRGIKKLKVIFSTEEPIRPKEKAADALSADEGDNTDESAVSGAVSPSPRRSVPGSSAFVPGAAGLMIAAEVVKDLIS